MSSTKVEQLIKTYKNLARHPTLVTAMFLDNGAIYSVWSQRNIEQGKRTKFSITYLKNPNDTDGTKQYVALPPVDVSNETLFAFSSDLKLKAVLREVENKETTTQYLDVWSDTQLYRSVDLTSLDLHGKVVTTDELAAFEWSPDGKKIMFVAEKKVPKKNPINKPWSTDDKAWKPESYRQDWGEQMVGIVSTVVVVYDVEEDRVALPEGLPEDVTVGQLTFSTQFQDKSYYIAGVVYRTVPRKLGLIYCTNRESTLFKLDFEGNYCEMDLPGKSVKSPIFYDFTLFWLQRDAGGPHHACMSLLQCKNAFTKYEDRVVKQDVVATKTDNFYGLYNVKLSKYALYALGMFVSTQQKNRLAPFFYKIDGSGYEWSDINILNVQFGDHDADLNIQQLLMSYRRPFMRDQLIFAEGIDKNASVSWSNADVSRREEIPEFKDALIEDLDFSYTNEDVAKDFSAVLLTPKVDGKVPLLVYPHGGPHSAFSRAVSLETYMYLAQGYGVLMINYRGSTGAGEQSVDFLLGKIGTSDVADCMYALNQTLEKYGDRLDADRIAVVGGSHGGFLATHLSGQYPNRFKAVIARNPVIDVAAMSITSDIPDWCYVECGAGYTQSGPMDDELLTKMRKSSPLVHAHKVKAPTLLQIGSKDLRVPPSQGLEYYHRLKANNVPVELYMYDDCHPLGSVTNEMEVTISSLMWLDKYLSNKD